MPKKFYHSIFRNPKHQKTIICINLVNRFDFPLTLKMKALIIFINRIIETFRFVITYIHNEKTIKNLEVLIHA